ncbi:MAG TPA: BON domain-containing protein [Gemmataceae bacterium]
MVRYVFPLTLAVGGWLGSGLGAQEPPRLEFLPNSPVTAAAPSGANQQLADSIAAQLRQSGTLGGANVSIIAIDGVVELRGSVRDEAQRQQIGQIVGRINGVARVNNQLLVAGQSPGALHVNAAGPDGGALLGAETDPVPLTPPTYPVYDLNPPKLPPHAWPTYAPYNNYSRVAYPLSYPYNAWPFIGPFYPFPKVPLGWRRVYLEWEDGHWWYGRKAVPHDYWRVRFW